MGWNWALSVLFGMGISMTLEDYIVSVNSGGWSLSLFQRPDYWCADLHSAQEGFTQCGLGPTPCEAIQSALSRPESTYFRMEPLKAHERIDLRELGLVKPREPIKRRF